MKELFVAFFRANFYGGSFTSLGAVASSGGGGSSTGKSGTRSGTSPSSTASAWPGSTRFPGINVIELEIPRINLGTFNC